MCHTLPIIGGAQDILAKQLTITRVGMDKLVAGLGNLFSILKYVLRFPTFPLQQGKADSMAPETSSSLMDCTLQGSRLPCHKDTQAACGGPVRRG